jgi:asparagine synthase (glutamine-hydrolysing)
MCGIAGYLGNKEISSSKILELESLMHNRGPDSFRFSRINIKKKTLYLFHSRLKIIDLSNKANQPFLYKGYILIFNGEIYNYKEIKEKLILKGYKFYTKSDTEVLLYSYIEFGKECVEYFDGMWSFAIWDPKKKSLFICRDRFGEKPLFFFRNNQELYFGSEVKYIQNLLNLNCSVNQNLIKKNLVFGYKSIHKNNETYFNNIYSLESSSFIDINLNNNFQIKKYWKPQFRPKFFSSLNEIKEKVYFILKKSLSDRLNSDVPIALSLSGGIDSSVLIGLLKKSLHCKDLTSFSLIDKGEYNEKDLINKTEKFLKIQNNFLKIDYKNFFKNLTSVIKYQNQPISTITYFAQNSLMKHISELGFKVVLSGTGADELFTGYYDHYPQFLSQLKNKKYLQVSLQEWKKGILPFLKNNELKNPLKYINNPNDRETIYDHWRQNYKFARFKINHKFEEHFFCRDLLRNRMLNELFYEITPPALRHEDLNCMQYSIENRSPYLNKNLLELMYSVPSEHLIKDGFLKYILRSTFVDEIHKDVYNNKQKQGFNASLDIYLKNENKKNIRDFFLGDKTMRDYVDMKLVFNSLNNKNNSSYTKKFIFNVINIKIFLENSYKTI